MPTPTAIDPRTIRCEDFSDIMHHEVIKYVDFIGITPNNNMLFRIGAQTRDGVIKVLVEVKFVDGQLALAKQ